MNMSFSSDLSSANDSSAVADSKRQKNESNSNSKAKVSGFPQLHVFHSHTLGVVIAK